MNKIGEIVKEYEAVKRRATKSVHDFARNYLKDNLRKVLPPAQYVFKCMYCDPKEPHKRIQNINVVINKMPASKLEWAMRQVELTLILQDEKYVRWENYCNYLVNHPSDMRVI